MKTGRVRSSCASLCAAVMLATVACGTLFAAVRMTEGVFFGCFYGNRGGHCLFDEADGTRHSIGMPTDDESPPVWVIDGVEVGYVGMDGGFSVPDHPAFAQDHARRYGTSSHPFRGCPLTLIEQPGETRVILDTADCTPVPGE